MEYDAEIYLLSQKFISDYPGGTYPELMYKQGRPYTCLLVDVHSDYFICIPYRSNINHQYAYLFTGTERSRYSRSGLDYSKIVIIKNSGYIDLVTTAVVDQDEYKETMANLSKIVAEAVKYVDEYINHISGKQRLHPREFSRRYQFSTLPYFHDVMGLSS